ncbi:MAG: transposase [Patescibacteria group bacterium]
MPAKNSLKAYLSNSYYHIYNRGVEKRPIFQDDQDRAVFLSYLKTYLMPKDEAKLKRIIADEKSPWKEKDQALKLLRLNNFHGEITLLAYCLMPNHFHLLIKQKSPESIDKFMNSHATRYTMYFNKKNKRVGSLFQNVYKAVGVESDAQLLYLTSYIHRNPLAIKSRKSASQGDALRTYFSQPSSLPEYLGMRHTEWISPEEILSFFSKTNPKLSYKAFIQQNEDLTIIRDYLLDF